MATRITISRRTYERLKDASLSGGIGWEVGGIVGFRKNGTVSLEIQDATWVRLNKISRNDPENAINILLDGHFYRRRSQ